MEEEINFRGIFLSLIHIYKKNKDNQWEVIYINPEKCIEDKLKKDSK